MARQKPIIRAHSMEVVFQEEDSGAYQPRLSLNLSRNVQPTGSFSAPKVMYSLFINGSGSIQELTIEELRALKALVDVIDDEGLGP